MSGAKRKLTVKWSKREKDLLINWPGHKADGHLICGVFSTKKVEFDPIKNRHETQLSVIEELEKRGYDITTLKFEVSLKDPA